MKVIIDTKIVVSAALRDKGPEEVLQFVVGRPDFQWVVSPAILSEYKQVLARKKFTLPRELLRQWEHFLDSVTICIEVPATIDFPRDPTDAKFLACAVAANAEWLITGDQDFTHARRLINTTILSVSLFKKLVCEGLS